MPWSIAAAGTLATGALATGGVIAGAQKSAAGQLASAYDKSNELQSNIYSDTKTNLQPYVTQGGTSLGQLGTGTASYTSPLLQTAQNVYGQAPTLGTLPTFAPTAADYTASPGYAWDLSQGINKLQNAGVAGLGSVSGNTLKALDKYTVGAASEDYYSWLKDVYTPEYKSKLANVTLPYDAAMESYNANVSNYNTGQTNQYKRLYDLANLGSTSASSLAGYGSTYASNYGSNLTSGAAATGSGNLASTKTLTGAANTALGYGAGSLYSSSGGYSLSDLFGGGSSSSGYGNYYLPSTDQTLNTPVYNYQIY